MTVPYATNPNPCRPTKTTKPKFLKKNSEITHSGPDSKFLESKLRNAETCILGELLVFFEFFSRSSGSGPGGVIFGFFSRNFPVLGCRKRGCVKGGEILRFCVCPRLRAFACVCVRLPAFACVIGPSSESLRSASVCVCARAICACLPLRVCLHSFGFVNCKHSLLLHPLLQQKMQIGHPSCLCKQDIYTSLNLFITLLLV